MEWTVRAGTTPVGEFSSARARQKERLLELFAACDPVWWDRHPLRDDANFSEAALSLFAYQFAWNRPFRDYCRHLKRTPETVRSWREIPLVPVTAFKEFPLFAGDPAGAPICYHSSGTTRGTRSFHYLRDTDLYDASLLPNFRRHLLPDRDRIRMISLIPSPADLPHSSLAHMAAVVLERHGLPGSGTFMTGEGVEWDRLLAALSEAGAAPVAILGTTAALVRVLDRLQQEGRQFRLPPGSRVMDTGGIKGVDRPLERVEFYELLLDRLGISERWCVNEYGMSEMGSQFYDGILTDGTRKKNVPPWVRTRVLHPETLEDVREGEIGILCHYDLANLDSVLALQTEDVGVRIGERFEIVGRAPGAEPRGCSLMTEGPGTRPGETEELPGSVRA